MDAIRYFGRLLRVALSQSLSLAQDIIFISILSVGAAIWVRPGGVLVAPHSVVFGW
jgi:hypothetical protein